MMQARTAREARHRSRLGPPPDSDLVGIPLVIGMALAIFAVIGAFWLNAWVGMVVLGAIVVVGLVLSYRVVVNSETDGQPR